MKKEIKVCSYVKEFDKWKSVTMLTEEERKNALKKINHQFLQSIGYKRI